MAPTNRSSAAFSRNIVIALIAFLTLVDLFAVQAILPALAQMYGVAPGTIGAVVNASTMGMAAGGLAIALFGRRINRRRGIVASLALLAIPTALLAAGPDLATFAVLRVAQGVLMSAAFTLTLAYLAEQCSAKDAAGASAAYITGNVSSNLFGRLLSAWIADHVGVAESFYALALLNLLGAALVYVAIGRGAAKPAAAPPARPVLSIWAEHLRNPPLRLSFGIGFCILFAFIGTFTYVNFVLVRPPLGLNQMTLGLVYFVFLPSIVTTPLAGQVRDRFGTRRTFWGALAVAAVGLPLLLLPSLGAVLAGLVLVGVGTFFAQAIATGFVGRAATADRAAASGLYLASYFLGGLVGGVVLGWVYGALGWPSCVAMIAASLVVAALLAVPLKRSEAKPVMAAV